MQKLPTAITQISRRKQLCENEAKMKLNKQKQATIREVLTEFQFLTSGTTPVPFHKLG